MFLVWLMAVLATGIVEFVRQDVNTTDESIMTTADNLPLLFSLHVVPVACESMASMACCYAPNTTDAANLEFR